MHEAQALLLIGIYGSGKTTVAEEVAGLLEARGEPFAAIDLDWLAWSNVPGAGHASHDVLARNLAAVAGTYLAAGALRLVVAGSVTERATLAALRDALGVPLTVIRLRAPITVIEARLAGAPTSGRADDLAAAREAFATETATGLEDAVVDNVGPIRDTALAVLRAAGWAA